jgi:hypothetical protein
VLFPLDAFFFFFFFRVVVSSASRDRVINAPCALPLRGFSPPVPGSIFFAFLGSCWGVDFFVVFDLSNNFFVIYIIINTSLTSSDHQNLLSARHKIIKTRQHTKNVQKIAVFEDLEKEA